MTVNPLRSALAALLLGVAGLVAVLAAAVPAEADVAPAAKQGTAPAETTPASTRVTDTADPGGAHALVAGGAAVVIAAGIGAGVWRSRRDPEAATHGH